MCFIGISGKGWEKLLSGHPKADQMESRIIQTVISWLNMLRSLRLCNLRSLCDVTAKNWCLKLIQNITLVSVTCVANVRSVSSNAKVKPSSILLVNAANSCGKLQSWLKICTPKFLFDVYVYKHYAENAVDRTEPRTLI